MKLLLALVAAAAASAQSRESIEKQLRSVDQQRESIRKMMPLPVAPSAPECNPLPEEQLAPILDGAAKKRELPVKLLRAVAERESGFRPCAVSEKGAQGLMQLMPATAEEYKVQDPFNAKENIEAGAAFLRALLEKFKGDLPLALAAYNAGPEAVQQISAVPDIPETRAYIDAIVEKVGSKKIELHP